VPEQWFTKETARSQRARNNRKTKLAVYSQRTRGNPRTGVW